LKESTVMSQTHDNRPAVLPNSEILLQTIPTTTQGIGRNGISDNRDSENRECTAVPQLGR